MNDTDQMQSDGGQTARIPLESFDEGRTTPESRQHKLAILLRDFVIVPWSILRHDWRAVLGLSIVAFYVVVGVVGSVVVEPTHTNDGMPFVGAFETMEHPLGTDNTGQDIFAQTIHSTPPILTMMVSGGLFTIVVGLLFGIVSGYKGGFVDTALSSIIDTFINIPGLPLVIVLAALLNPENPVVIGVLLASAAWAGLARAVRSQVLTIRNEAFVENARVMGLSTPYLLVKHVIPPLGPYMAINTVQAMRNILFSAVALYFIGALPFSDSNWGITLNLAYHNGAMYRPDLLHWLVVPIVAIVGISIGLMLLAQSLDRVFNPRVRARHLNNDDE